MEEQNQEKETATQHVTVSDAAAPETGTENKGKKSGEKDRKPAKELTPKQMQQRKKLLVYPLMGLLFLGSMWLIFAPSDKKDESGETVGAFNADTTPIQRQISCNNQNDKKLRVNANIYSI